VNRINPPQPSPLDQFSHQFHGLPGNLDDKIAVPVAKLLDPPSERRLRPGPGLGRGHALIKGDLVNVMSAKSISDKTVQVHAAYSVLRCNLRVSRKKQDNRRCFPNRGDRLDRGERSLSAIRRPSSRPISYFPVGTRRLSSSNQFWTRIISVTGVGFLCSSLTMRNRCPSWDRS
jgi:hypothetical protein